MTIAEMQRVTLCGMDGERAAVLADLQDLGCLHLVPLAPPRPLEPESDPVRRRATAAFHHLVSAPRRLRPWPAQREIDVDAVIEAALANKERLRQARDRADFLRERIENLDYFGDFELPPLFALRGRRLWFYVLPVKHRRALERIEMPWAVVGQDNTRLFVAVVAVEEPPADLLPVPRTHTGSRQLSHLREDLVETEIEIEVAEGERAELTRNALALGLRLAEAEDADARAAAERMTLSEEHLFAVAGWAPSDRAEDLLALARARGLAIMLEPPQDDEEPPTLLANTGRFEGASGLTSFYTTPAYRAWDPSIIVLISFAIFFAMILADAGYALVLCAGAFLVSGRIKRRAGGRQALAVVWAVLATALVYGVLAGSYFGLTLPPDSVLARLALIDVEDIETMMMVSIVVGVIHISIANGVAAYSARRASDIRNKLGWIAATWGGLAMWLGAPVAGAAVLAGGLLAVFVARWPDRPVQRPLDWLWRVADGGLALTRVTTLFGDVLSYMRLFALGLASASLAATFNGIASGIVEGMPGVGLLLALLVLLFGHGINLTLGIMSGLVHGLRLNFIEFFGWALSGEGYPFRPLARKERPTWTD